MAHADQVVAIEVDAGLLARLRGGFADEPRVTLIHGDILETDLKPWAPAALVGNLPYYITSPILEKYFALGPEFPTAVFLMQREVAGRLTAAPGSRDYGFLTVET